jgi:hypothetical protein
MYRAPETDERFSYHYFGNPEVHEIKHPEKIKSLALSLAGASAPSGRHRKHQNLVQGMRDNKRYTWNVMA